MSNLLYHIDRLAQQAKLLSSTSNSILSCSVGPFTNAALHASLEDIIRDIHPGELGLFTIVPEAPARPKNADVKEIAVERVPFAGATPLRRRTTTGKVAASGEGEAEPEVYTQAALKYLDRLYVSNHCFFCSCSY